MNTRWGADEIGKNILALLGLALEEVTVVVIQPKGPRDPAFLQIGAIARSKKQRVTLPRFLKSLPLEGWTWGKISVRSIKLRAAYRLEILAEIKVSAVKPKAVRLREEGRGGQEIDPSEPI